MTVRFDSNFPHAVAFLRDAHQGALAATALHAANQGRREARGGFKSGAFVTRGWQSITYALLPGVARVGSTEKHFAYWQMGHHNVFTRRWERNEWLTRALTQNRGELERQAANAVGQVARRYALPTAIGRVLIQTGAARLVR